MATELTNIVAEISTLEAEGFEHLNNFQGGMMAWYSHNYPLSK